MGAPLYEKLLNYKTKDIYPFHTPGHKRQSRILGFGEIAEIDITEIDGFDNLYQSKGIIKKAQDNAKELYQTKDSYFLVNGSTVGILAAITSQCKRGSKVIVARNCHRSVYNAIMIKELDPIYVMPGFIKQEGIVGGINPAHIEKLIKQNKNVSAVIITSPTYDGVISNVREIANITNSYDILLIVDEAHGSHLGITADTSKGAIKEGADIVIHSLHKTLPALTQTALLHIITDRVNKVKLEKSLAIFQTSSPSYLLMASIDNCIHILLSQKKELFWNYINNIREFRTKLMKLENIHLVGPDIIGQASVFQYDITKLVFRVKNLNIDGIGLSQILLNKYNIQVEYSTKDYFLAMTSIFDTIDGFNRLANAIINIDKKLNKVSNTDDIWCMETIPTKVVGMNNVEDLDYIDIDISDAVDKVNADFITPYPPGIPLLVPGELIDIDTIQYIKQLLVQGVEVLGIRYNKIISVVDEEKQSYERIIYNI